MLCDKEGDKNGEREKEREIEREMSRKICDVGDGTLHRTVCCCLKE